MSEIIKVFKESVPAMRFIGLKYGQFTAWSEAFGWFDKIEQAMGGVQAIKEIWENGGGYVGLERKHESEPFEYWIGMFTPAGTPVPEGLQYVDFPKGNLGTCWIYAGENEIRDTSLCEQKLKEAGYEITPDEHGGVWSFENCTCPRFTTPDEKGKIIDDYCYFIK